MLVIVASYWDSSARGLAERWAQYGARRKSGLGSGLGSGLEVGLLTPRDLSLAGWRLHADDTDSAVCVIEGRPVAQRAVTGVLTRLPCVSPRELTHIAAADRPYVAAEMTAFLLFWLSQLRCPVLNRPTASCVAGPLLRPEQWVHLAARAGIPVQPLRRAVGPRIGSAPALDPSPGEEDSTAPAAILTVVGERTFGDADRALHRHALRIAQLAHAELLSVSFSTPEAGAQFVSASIFPELSGTDPAGADLAGAVFEHLAAAQAAHV